MTIYTLKTINFKLPPCPLWISLDFRTRRLTRSKYDSRRTLLSWLVLLPHLRERGYGDLSHSTRKTSLGSRFASRFGVPGDSSVCIKQAQIVMPLTGSRIDMVLQEVCNSAWVSQSSCGPLVDVFAVSEPLLHLSSIPSLRYYKKQENRQHGHQVVAMA